jgi:hypothetical protein
MRFSWLPLFIPFLTLASGVAEATSTGKAAAKSPHACVVAAKFLEAGPENGKISWIFEPLKSYTAPQCRSLRSTFKVIIPSGSFSTKTQTNIYPLSITEPARGAEVSLRLVHYPSIGWLIAAETDSFKVIR